jgi:hypothetical protein
MGLGQKKRDKRKEMGEKKGICYGGIVMLPK